MKSMNCSGRTKRIEHRFIEALHLALFVDSVLTRREKFLVRGCELLDCHQRFEDMAGLEFRTINSKLASDIHEDISVTNRPPWKVVPLEQFEKQGKVVPPDKNY